MNTLKRESTARIYRNIARWGILSLTSITFLFALVSGANPEEGLGGILQNSPNTIPWVIMFGLLAIAWKTEIIGGLLLLLYSVALYVFFVVMSNHFFLAPFILTLLFMALSGCFVYSWFLKWKK